MAAEAYTAKYGGANASTRSLANALGVSRRTLGAYSRNDLNVLAESLSGSRVQGLDRIDRALFDRYSELTRRNESLNADNFQQRARTQDRINAANNRMQERIWEERRRQRGRR